MTSTPTPLTWKTALAVSVLAGLGPASGQPATFEAPALYPVESAPRSVATGDLDGDGHLDLVTANRTDKSVSVLLGAGDGTFGAASSVAVGDPQGVYNGLAAVALGDVDGDGDLDAVVSGSSYEVYTLLGAGDGSFTPTDFQRFDGVRIQEAREVALADLDGDDALDLVMASSQDLVVYAGDGSGGFALSTVIDLGAGIGTRTGLAVGDFDGDEALDVAAGNGSGAVLVALNDGAGALQTPTPYALTNPTPDVVAADLDGDGDLDLATTSDALLNDGTGVFTASQSGFTSLGLLVSVDAADLDLDDAVDLALTNASDQVSVVRGRGDGTFLPVETYDLAFEGAWGVTAADLDGDDAPDLVVTDAGGSASTTGQIAVLLNASVGGVDLAEDAPATGYWLGPAYPNPVSRTAAVPYALPEAARVRLDLYDALGRRVAALVDREQPAGRYVVRLPTGTLANGTYVVRLEAGPFVGTGTVQVAR